MLLVELRVPEAWQKRARYAFRMLATRWRIPLRFTQDSTAAHICYTRDPSLCSEAVTAFRFDPDLYDPQTKCEAFREAGEAWTWGKRGSDEQPDLVGAVYRLLVFLDETQVATHNRDRRGIFSVEALPEERRRVADRPLVEYHAEILLQKILRRHPSLVASRLEAWPKGKRSVVCLTHDVDAVHLGAVLELSTNLTKGMLRRDLNHVRLFLAGFRFVGRKSSNPYFAFPVWRDWESSRDVRSAFFVYYRPQQVRADVNDCKTSLAGRGTDWTFLRRMADDGWEFGLHPSIHTKSRRGAFEACKTWLEGSLGRRVEGLRHHYWALDWNNPAATQKMHEEAGFRYDSSIAWRDRAGFRAGTALPFRPFDPASGRELDLIEIPCVLMDNHVLKRRQFATWSRAAAVSHAREVCDRVHECGGVMTLNWHQETGMNRFHYTGYLEVLNEVLEPLLASSDVWAATPTEIADHWRGLSKVLFADGKDEPSLALA